MPEGVILLKHSYFITRLKTKLGNFKKYLKTKQYITVGAPCVRRFSTNQKMAFESEFQNKFNILDKNGQTIIDNRYKV